MPSPLSHLDDWRGDEPPKRVWHEMLREIIRRLPSVLDFGMPEQSDFVFPWQTTVQPWTDPAAASYPAPQNLLWRVDIQTGCINDTPTTIRYQRQKDPRGWVAPRKYVFPKPGDVGYSPLTVDRPMFEPTDPPFFVVQAPPSGQPSANWVQFIPVPDAIRPDFFKTADMWELTLMRCSLVVNCDSGVSNATADSTLRRFQVNVVPRAPIPAAGQFEGSVELARLFLTRTADNDPDNDEMYVQQLVFFDLQAAMIEPNIQSLVGQEPAFMCWTV